MIHKRVVIDTTQGLIHFLLLAKPVKNDRSKTSAKAQSFLTDDNTTIPPMTT